MRVMILANNDVGLYKFRRELLEALLQKEYEVYIALPDGEYVPLMREMGCHFVETPFDRHGTNPLAELKLLAKYRRILADIRPDVVLTYTIKPNIYGGIACAGLGIPYIANITGLGMAVESGGVFQRPLLRLYRFGLRKARMVFFQNEADQRFFVKQSIVTGAYSLLPGSGVNLERFSLKPYPACGNGTDGSPVKLAFISRIMREKGIDYYLTAAKKLRSKFPSVEFHVCGVCEDDYESRLRELDKEGIIRYHGMVHDVAEFMSGMHCIVHPTYYPEGLSNVLLEACSSGRPVITTDRVGCREVVTDGVNGYLIRERSGSELVVAIERFLGLEHDRKAAMGAEGRHLVESRFSREIVVAAYIKEIEKIAEETAHGAL